jgi:hypothetical protein
VVSALGRSPENVHANERHLERRLKVFKHDNASNLHEFDTHLVVLVEPIDVVLLDDKLHEPCFHGRCGQLYSLHLAAAELVLLVVVPVDPSDLQEHCLTNIWRVVIRVRHIAKVDLGRRRDHRVVHQELYALHHATLFKHDNQLLNISGLPDERKVSLKEAFGNLFLDLHEVIKLNGGCRPFEVKQAAEISQLIVASDQIILRTVMTLSRRTSKDRVKEGGGGSTKAENHL